MHFYSKKLEQGGVLVTRICGIPLRKRRIMEMTGEEKSLRNEMLMVHDLSRLPPACGFARDVQLVALVLLRETMRVADQEGFHPWLISGGLLGVVRGGGNFIPWDDDVDLAMIREEYEKFVEVFNAKARSGFSARYRYSARGTKIKIEHRDLPKGMSMTIFVFDRYLRPLPSLAEKHELFRKVKQAQKEIDKILPKRAKDEERRRVLEDYRNRVVLEGRRSAPESEHPAIFWGVEYSVPDFYLETASDYEEVYPLKRGRFEGIDVNIPQDAEAILSYKYGNWGAWPGLLSGHHLMSSFSLEKALALRRFLRSMTPSAE